MILQGKSEEVIALYESAGIPGFECVLCGSPGFAEFPYEEMGACSNCVRMLASAYAIKHSGEPDPLFSSDEEIEAFNRDRRSRFSSKKIPIPHMLRKAVLERDAYRCQKCGDHHDLHVDHIFPESRGGEAALENLQCLCRPCNIKKGARI